MNHTSNSGAKAVISPGKWILALTPCTSSRLVIISRSMGASCYQQVRSIIDRGHVNAKYDQGILSNNVAVVVMERQWAEDT